MELFVGGTVDDTADGEYPGAYHLAGFDARAFDEGGDIVRAGAGKVDR